VFLILSITTRRILVDIKPEPYEVLIQNNGLEYLGEELIKAKIKLGTKVLIVTNPDVAEAYADIVLRSLEKEGFISTILIIKAGENKKNLASITEIHDAAYKAQLERGSLILALGGGVVGDMAGFAAATWLRGIAVVQVPTTLLAMVDASIGGKTGVNHSKGKNLIGSFHQPKLVLIDPSTLKTLPTKEFQAGMAEVIKYGVIGDKYLFELLENEDDISSLESFNRNIINEVIYRSAMAKAEIVSQDENEKGLRAILNYGHTFGHVIETLCGYGTWLHGQAVSIGMVAVGELAVQRGCWTRDSATRQKKLLAKAGLPIKLPHLNTNEILITLKADKKVKDGKIRFIIPEKIGKVSIEDNINTEEIQECLERL